MSSSTILAQALGIAYAAGINLPATVAILGLAQHLQWIGKLPAGLDLLASWWIIALALLLFLVEFSITLVPGIASLWESAQSFVRPLAGVFLAVATTYHLDPIYMVVAGLLGGGLALTTHGTKLGIRYAVDTSPEPVTNFAANIGEVTMVASVCLAIWQHPYVTLAIALVLLLLLLLLVRQVARFFKRRLWPA